MSAPIVILGSGLAGYGVAREFRKLDKSRRLVIASRDHGGFYYKPGLSNALSLNKTADALITKTSDQMAQELNATIHVNRVARSIDTKAHAVLFEDGGSQAYGSLVLAVGADPIRLPLQGDAADDAISVNDLDDFRKFSTRLTDVRNVAILGAGLIGCEFANDLLCRDIVPTVIDPEARPLSRLLPEPACTLVRQRLEQAGARFKLGVFAHSVHRDGEVLRLSLTDGSTLSADLVLSAVGLKPRISLARDAGLRVNRGIVTDRRLATSASDVFAIGDCAEVDGLVMPYVLPLMHQARVLASVLAGKPAMVTYPAMPVTVKTPACPTVVAPPIGGAVGQWVAVDKEGGLETHFRSSDGALLGFALVGDVTKRQKLANEIAPLWN